MGLFQVSEKKESGKRLSKLRGELEKAVKRINKCQSTLAKFEKKG